MTEISTSAALRTTFLFFVRWIRGDNVATRCLHCARPSHIDRRHPNSSDESKKKKIRLNEGTRWRESLRRWATSCVGWYHWRNKVDDVITIVRSLNLSHLWFHERMTLFSFFIQKRTRVCEILYTISFLQGILVNKKKTNAYFEINLMHQRSFNSARILYVLVSFL